MKTQPLGPFLGENNRLQDFDLHVNRTGDFLRSTLNIDLDNKGTIHRRRATKLIQALTGAHSLHMVSDTAGYIGQGNVLYPVTTDGETMVLGGMLKLLSGNDPVSWLQDGDDLYYSNGTDSGRITAGVWYPLGIATPATPTLSIVAGGLLAGWYQVGVSYSNSVTGEESGISASGNIEITTPGAIHVALPGAAVGADKVNVYLSGANGSVVYLLATLPAATASYDCTALASGRESSGRFEDPLPAGELFMSNGRLCSFKGKTIYVGLPWRHGYYLPAGGYISFSAPVTIAVENQGGTYIVADKTRWFPGSDLNNIEAMISDVLPFGAVRGTAFRHPKEPKVGWFSDKGVVLADAGGNVETLTADAFDVVLPASGTAVTFDGEWRRVVSCGYCVNLETKALTTYSGWDFTSVSGAYGTKADGVYLLNCDGLVDASIGLGKQDFGTEALKHLPAVYVGADCDEPMQLQVKLPKGVDYTYPARNAGEDMQLQRFDPGKGLRANWYDLTVSNSNGADFTLASVSFAPTASTRRI